MELLSNVGTVAATYEASANMSGGALAVFSILYVAFIVLMITSVWKIFVKAGRPGWASIIPFYNTITMVEIAGKPV